MEVATDLGKGSTEEADKKVQEEIPPVEGSPLEGIPEVTGRCFISMMCVESETGAEKVLAVVDLDARDTLKLVFHGETKTSEAEVFTFSFLEEALGENMNRRDRENMYRDLESQLSEELLSFEQLRAKDDNPPGEADDSEYVPYEELSLLDKLDVIQSDLQYIESKRFGGVLGRLLGKIC